ncbi:hypothetical protein DICA0_F00364 [Diutina catenulata]
MKEEELAQLRRRVHENDKANRVACDRINQIFAGCRQPEPATNAQKLLATQLTRLTSLNVQARGVQTASATASVRADLNQLAAEVEAKKAQLAEVRQRVRTEASGPSNVEETTNVLFRTARVAKQAQETQNHAWAVAVSAMFDRRDALLFCARPIINVDDIASAPILDLNEFIENLVRLQQVLTKIFGVNLPFLDDLSAKVLPNAHFFDLIRDKEAKMRGTDQDTEEEPKEATDSLSQSPESPGWAVAQRAAPTVQVAGTKGTTIATSSAPSLLLPRSSKTINSQRRASYRSASVSSIPSVTVVPEAPPTHNTTNQRRVIIPHRVLAIPLAKSTAKDLCRFLGLLVKILVNFHVFFNTQHIRYHSVTNLRDLLARLVQREPSSEQKSLDVPKLLREVYSAVVRRHGAPQLQGLDIVAMMAGTDDWERVSQSCFNSF